jgi:predicted RNA-binding Zn-ribbon protein involved in translation (DUF1610 family)
MIRKSNPNASARYDVTEVKRYAAGRWRTIISQVAGISVDYLDPRSHSPCPKCGGTKRWRFTDSNRTSDDVGGAVCNHCGKFADGIAVIEWFLGIEFHEALSRVAEFLGVPPVGKRYAKSSKTAKSKASSCSFPGSNNSANANASDKSICPVPSVKVADVKPMDGACDMIFGSFAKAKGVKVDTVRKMGGIAAKYHGVVVIAFPLIADDDSSTQIGWTLYQFQGRGLPRWDPKTETNEMCKTMNIK